jgi:hypothetical protein
MGRVMDEALARGPVPRGARSLQKLSPPAGGGVTTILQYQVYTDGSGGEFRYFDAAGFAGGTVGLEKR